MIKSREEFVAEMLAATSLTEEDAVVCKRLTRQNLTPKNPRLPESHCEWVGPARGLMKEVFGEEF